MARPKLKPQLATRASRPDRPRRGLGWFLAALAPVAALIVVGAVLLLARDGGPSTPGVSATSVGLPDTPDYHSLLVDPSDPEAITLGSHAGLHRSSDGGRTWASTELSGRDAMNLVPTGQDLWVAGHLVLARSRDGGRTWQDMRPRGLPSLDLHGFAARPGGSELYAAVAGEGLYRSTDGGETFAVASREVGGSVFGLAATAGGGLLAADTIRGLLASDDAGLSWRRVIGEPMLGVAINPADPRTVVATGNGIYRSGDAGRTWTRVLEIAKGAGPVAWSPSAPKVAYVVGFDRLLYRTDDAGTTWRAVRAGT